MWLLPTLPGQKSLQLSLLQTDLTNYIDKAQANWIADVRVEREGNTYLQELKKYNVDRYLELYKNAYRRFPGKIIPVMTGRPRPKKLLTDQYAPTGRAGRDGLGAIRALQNITAVNTPENQGGVPAGGKKEFANNIDTVQVFKDFKYRRECLDLCTEACRRYCRTVNSIDDFRIAPFHILATENKVWNGENHLRYLSVIKEYMTGTGSIFIPTMYTGIDLNDEHSANAGIDWWTNLTRGEGDGCQAAIKRQCPGSGKRHSGFRDCSIPIRFCTEARQVASSLSRFSSKSYKNSRK